MRGRESFRQEPLPGNAAFDMQTDTSKDATFLKKQWGEWRNTLLFVVFVLVPVKSSLADWNWVPTGSMNPTIVEGDMVYVNKLAYDLRVPLTLHSLRHRSDPERGDISVLFSPEDDKRLVKRVIGLPGDELELINNVLFINGAATDYSPLADFHSADLEPELRERSNFAEENLDGRKHAVMSIPSLHSPLGNFSKLTVPEGHYFVMGDNRDASKDSRVFGFAERKLFVGEATRVIVSFNMLDKFQPRLRRFFKRLD